MGSKYHLQKLLRIVSTTHLTTSSSASRLQGEALVLSSMAQNRYRGSVIKKNHEDPDSSSKGEWVHAGPDGGRVRLWRLARFFGTTRVNKNKKKCYDYTSFLLSDTVPCPSVGQ